MIKHLEKTIFRRAVENEKSEREEGKECSKTDKQEYKTRKQFLKWVRVKNLRKS